MIKIPESLTPESVIEFSKEIYKTPLDNDYLLDFSRLGHIEPFGMLMLSAVIRQFKNSRKLKQGNDIKFRAANFEGKSYASWMGLFKSFGLDHGNDVGQVSGNANYIPITRITSNRVVREASEKYVHHGEVIERESARLAQVLTRTGVGQITETLTYSIREIMRNVIEHSTASHIWIAAQYWPQRRIVEIAILDEGIGILESLKRNPKHTFDNDEKALFMAVQPGISGVKKRKGRHPHGDWANSGYGLYMTSSLSQKGGDFLICSGNKAMRLHGEESEFFDAQYQGTAIRMVLDTSQIDGLDQTLSQLRDMGERLAGELREDAQLTASKMSRMLARKI